MSGSGQIFLVLSRIFSNLEKSNTEIVILKLMNPVSFLIKKMLGPPTNLFRETSAVSIPQVI